MIKPVQTKIAQIGTQYVALFVRDAIVDGVISEKVLDTKFFATEADAQAWGSEQYAKFDVKAMWEELSAVPF